MPIPVTISGMTDFSVERDRWGRPMLFPPEGGKAVAYTRPSTMAKWLDSQAGLINWKASQAMIGMARSKPIQARIAAIVARTENDAYRENKEALKDLVENATQIAQAQGRADLGTAVHEFTELLDAGTLDWTYVPEQLKGPLHSYQEKMSSFTMVDSEVFVTIDEPSRGKNPIRGAGSMDRIIHHPELGFVVADIKTGTDEPKYPLGVTTQVSIYSRGKRYRDGRFSGSPSFTDGVPNADETAWRKPLHPELNTSIGVMIHLPLPTNPSDRPECALYELDLEAGWESLLLGHKVQEARRPPKLKRLA
jgi:hypothetical protein